MIEPESLRSCHSTRLAFIDDIFSRIISLAVQIRRSLSILARELVLITLYNLSKSQIRRRRKDRLCFLRNIESNRLKVFRAFLLLQVVVAAGSSARRGIQLISNLIDKATFATLTERHNNEPKLKPVVTQE